MRETYTINDFVHRDSSGRWHVAMWVESAHQYQAPLRRNVKTITGCSTAFSSMLENLSGHYSYSRKSSAVARAKQVYEMYLGR